MKIFCKFPTVNISKLNFWLVICIAKSFIWTNLKVIFSIFRFFCTLRFQIFKYCPIITNHTSMYKYINLSFKKLTLMTGFVVQGHICSSWWEPLIYGSEMAISDVLKKMTLILTVKDCKNATVKTYYFVNGKFPYYIRWKRTYNWHFQNSLHYMSNLMFLVEIAQGQGQGRFICHIHNHTEYNQQWNAGIFWRKIQQTRGERGGKK